MLPFVRRLWGCTCSGTVGHLRGSSSPTRPTRPSPTPCRYTSQVQFPLTAITPSDHQTTRRPALMVHCRRCLLPATRNRVVCHFASPNIPRPALSLAHSLSPSLTHFFSISLCSHTHATATTIYQNDLFSAGADAGHLRHAWHLVCRHLARCGLRPGPGRCPSCQEGQEGQVNARRKRTRARSLTIERCSQYTFVQGCPRPILPGTFHGVFCILL